MHWEMEVKSVVKLWFYHQEAQYNLIDLLNYLNIDESV
jgi:hypothetical protein